jgi:hypothetical protein
MFLIRKAIFEIVTMRGGRVGAYSEHSLSKATLNAEFMLENISAPVRVGVGLYLMFLGGFFCFLGRPLFVKLFFGLSCLPLFSSANLLLVTCVDLSFSPKSEAYDA